MMTLLRLGFSIALAACGTRQPASVAPSHADRAVSAVPARAADEAAPPPAARGATPAFHCHAWVHGGESSTDCYRDALECERERSQIESGARSVTPECEPREVAVCTQVVRPPATATFERCFAEGPDCERYTAFVASSGHHTTPCALQTTAEVRDAGAPR